LLMPAPGGYRLALAGEADVTPGAAPSPVGFY